MHLNSTVGKSRNNTTQNKETKSETRVPLRSKIGLNRINEIYLKTPSSLGKISFKDNL
jgi:hypothetical protein